VNELYKGYLFRRSKLSLKIWLETALKEAHCKKNLPISYSSYFKDASKAEKLTSGTPDLVLSTGSATNKRVDRKSVSVQKTKLFVKHGYLNASTQAILNIDRLRLDSDFCDLAISALPQTTLSLAAPYPPSQRSEFAFW
jgi:hypothetical protein